MTTKKRREEMVVHDLFSREIRPIRNWHEFLERWQVATTLEEMLGLLHVGFNISSFDYWEYGEKEYFPVDRLIFYFKIADGWMSSGLLNVSTDDRQEYRYGVGRNGNVIWKSQNELRQILAIKAFNQLCLNFFRPEGKDGNGQEGRSGHYWVISVVTDKLFPVILDFFRAEKGQYSEEVIIRNLDAYEDAPHNEKQANSFLLDLAVFLWAWQEEDVESWTSDKDKVIAYNTSMRARIELAKPWMIEILSRLRRLDVLDKVILKLSEDCLAKIEEIALRCQLNKYRHPVREDRQVLSLDEARYVGSRAAWFLEKCRLKRQEHYRLTAILDAEDEADEAQRKIKELSNPVSSQVCP